MIIAGEWCISIDHDDEGYCIVYYHRPELTPSFCERMFYY